MLHHRYHIAWRRPRHVLKVLALSAALFAGMPLAMQEPMPSALIRLTGNMEMNCQLIIAETNEALDLLHGSIDQPIATVGEKCNRAQGYTVTLSSANAGMLVSAAGARAPYTVRYGSAEPVALSRPLALVRPEPATWTATQVVAITLPAQPAALAGDYIDRIMLTIAPQ